MTSSLITTRFDGKTRKTRVSGRRETSTDQRTHTIICDHFLFLWMKLHSCLGPRKKPTAGGKEGSDTRIFGTTYSFSCVFGGVSTRDHSSFIPGVGLVRSIRKQNKTVCPRVCPLPRKSKKDMTPRNMLLKTG